MRLTTLLTTIWKRNNEHLLQLQQSYIFFKYRKGNTNKKYLMAVWTLSGPWYLEDMKNLVHQEQQSVFTRHHGGHIGVPKQ